MGVIALEGIKVYGYHGVYPIERKQGNPYVVDVYLESDLRTAMHSDRLIDTLDYYKVYQLVLACMKEPVNLIEHLAAKIGQAILDRFQAVAEVRIRLTKVSPIAMGKCEKTYVELLFDRAEIQKE